MQKKIVLACLVLLLANGSAFAQMEEMLKGIAATQKSQKSKSSSVEFLSGRINITIREVKYHNPARKGRRRCEQKKTCITANFYGRISKSRVKMYTVKPAERLKCEAYTHCPVFDGSSKYVLERDMNTMKITNIKEYPLSVSSQYMEQDFRWLKNKEQYVVCASSSVAGNNTLEGLTIEIKPYKPADNSTGATIATLTSAYVLWIT